MSTFAGDAIAWLEYDKSTKSYYIQSYDIATSNYRRLTTGPKNKMWPHTDGKTIVYQDLVYSNDDNLFSGWDHSFVMAYDVKTRTARQITSEQNTAIYPRVRGDRITWLDYRNAANPYHKQSPTGVELRIYDYDIFAQNDSFIKRERVLVEMRDYWKQSYELTDNAVVIHAGKGDIDGLYYCAISD
jgi:hypothetical protein